MQLVWHDALEAFAAIFALVSALVKVNPLDVGFAVTFLFELLGAVLTHKPLILVVDPNVGCQVFPRLEPYLTVHTGVGGLLQMDN